MLISTLKFSEKTVSQITNEKKKLGRQLMEPRKAKIKTDEIVTLLNVVYVKVYLQK